MAFSEYHKERIERILKEKGVSFKIKKMMGGVCFLINEKLCAGIDFNKVTKKDRLMVRIGEDVMEKSLAMQGCKRMDMTGRPMKGYVFIEADGFDADQDLEKWIQMGLDFNPLAKSSKNLKL